MCSLCGCGWVGAAEKYRVLEVQTLCVPCYLNTKTNQAPGHPSPKDLVWKIDVNNFNMKQIVRDAMGESEDSLSAPQRDLGRKEFYRT